MSHSFHRNLVHITFSTKHRDITIDPAWEARLHAYLGGIIREMNGQALAIGGMPDHVHILARTPATIADADFMRTLKSRSTGWVKQEKLSSEFGWQQGYGWFSIGASLEKAVIRYIQNQKRHHEKLTYREEFIQFLRKYGLDFDERYLWK